MQWQALIFDLDGTLVDSADDIAEAVNRTYDEVGLPRVDPLQVHLWIGEGVQSLMTSALNHHGSALSLERVMPAFAVHYNDCLLRSPQLYNGVFEALTQFKAEGLPLAMCTNKPVDLVPALLAHLGIEHFFDVIIGGGSLPQKKPHPEPLIETAKRLGISVSDCLMVGDSETDYRAAKAANMPIALVRYGYPRGLDLNAVEAIAVVDDLRALATPPAY